MKSCFEFLSHRNIVGASSTMKGFTYSTKRPAEKVGVFVTYKYYFDENEFVFLSACCM